MRTVLIITVVLAALLFDLRPAPAGGYAPWCAVLSMGRGDAIWDCRYATFEQCRPNILAGNRGFCNQNPWYEGWWTGQEPARRPLKRRRHRG